jgi:hypothetical protein
VAHLHSFEAKIIVVEIFIVDDGRVEFVGMSHDNVISLLGDHGARLVVFGIDIGVEIMNNLGKLFLGLLVQIRHCDAAELVVVAWDSTERQGWHNQDALLSCKRRSRQQGCRVQLSSRPNLLEKYTEMERAGYLVDARNDFLGDGNRVNMFRVKTITKLVDACSNLDNTLATYSKGVALSIRNIPCQTGPVLFDRLSTSS